MANPGDKVKITTSEGVYEGILMPRPELLGNDVYIVKQSSGYNVGIDKDKVQNVEVVKEYEAKVTHAKKVKHNSSLPTVAVISCGGTISSKIDYTTGGVLAEYDANDLLAMCPEITSIANLKAIPLMNAMSEDMNSSHWKKIAKAVKEELDDENICGVVVTQGTDTMHYTTAALSFMLQNLSKPVIVTGSQRSVDRGSSDAFMNLTCAVNAAANFDGVGVFLCMHATGSDDYCYLHYGTKVRKMHTLRRDAFRSVNAKPVAKVSSKKVEPLNTAYLLRPEEKVETILDAKFEKKTGLVYVHPGFDSKVLDWYKEQGYKGMVIAATALGHVPNDCVKKIKELSNDMIIVIATQTLYGRVEPLVYAPARELSIGAGCIFAHDMMPEVAYTKLGYVLGKTDDKIKVAKLMNKNMAYEIALKHEPEMFLN